MDNIKPFKGQDFESLLAEHDSSHLFEDPLFPATGRSMYHNQTPPNGIVWKRPPVLKIILLNTNY
jgi:hypothetical protein